MDELLEKCLNMPIKGVRKIWCNDMKQLLNICYKISAFEEKTLCNIRRENIM